ncbi:MAG: CPXCG motif-containing cysteine-rich protein [Sumerlaeia bacterium]
MMLDSTYECAYCGETVWTTVDPSAGRNQSYTEDCQVCCRPNILSINIDESDDGVEAFIITEQEY